MKFGEFVKELRMKQELGLREFCKEYSKDPSNWSKVERGILPPPNDEAILEEWAFQLKLEKGSANWLRFFDLAYTEKGNIPKDILTQDELVNELPLFFRTIRGQKPTPEEREKLLNFLRLDP